MFVTHSPPQAPPTRTGSGDRGLADRLLSHTGKPPPRAREPSRFSEKCRQVVERPHVFPQQLCLQVGCWPVGAVGTC